MNFSYGKSVLRDMRNSDHSNEKCVSFLFKPWQYLDEWRGLVVGRSLKNLLRIGDKASTNGPEIELGQRVARQLRIIF